jgi:hypothetical protein
MRILEIIKDEKDRFSSNRFIGVLSGLTLCISLLVSAFSHKSITPDANLIEAVVFICTSGLGFGMVNKIAEKIYGRPKDSGEDKTTPSEAQG